MTKNRKSVTKARSTDVVTVRDTPPRHATMVAPHSAAPSEAAEAAALRAALAAGHEERISAAFANRIIDGENALRVYREYRGLTQVALAEKSGVSRSYIADIETGSRDGTVSAYRKLADALGVLIDDLVD